MNPEFRKHIRETHHLVDELRDALQPEPLPKHLEHRIRTLISQPAHPATPRLLRIVGPLALATAAAVVALLVLHRPGQPALRHEAPAAMALSAEDAAEIVDAYSLLAWTGHLDYSIEQVRSQIDQLEQRVERGPAVPWTADDDWDAPRPPGNGALPIRARSASAGFASQDTKPDAGYVYVPCLNFSESDRLS